MPDPIDGGGEALRRLRMRHGRVEMVERPIYLVAGDHQRGTDTDGVVVGVLTTVAMVFFNELAQTMRPRPEQSIVRQTVRMIEARVWKRCQLCPRLRRDPVRRNGLALTHPNALVRIR